MVCVMLATLRQHVDPSVVFGEKIPDTTPTFPAKSMTLYVWPQLTVRSLEIKIFASLPLL